MLPKTNQTVSCVIVRASMLGTLTLLLMACNTSRPAPSSAALTPQALADSGLTVGSTRSLQVTTLGFANRFLRHTGDLGFTDVVNASSADALKQDASWKVVAGLADKNCYSFESVNAPGSYLRHAYYRVRLDKGENSPLFNNDATWCARDGLSGTGVSFESKNYPGSYLRHYNAELWLAKKGEARPTDAAGSFEQDTSWNIAGAWSNVIIDPPAPPPVTPPTTTRKLPPVQANWSYNIGAKNTSAMNGGATPSGSVISLDLYDVNAATIARLTGAGKYVICYYSAGTSENYRSDAQSQRLLAPNLNLGEVGRGDGGVWEGEKWLDVRGFADGASSSAAAKAEVIRSVMASRLELAHQKGCAAVEPDNVDAWANDVSQNAPAGTPKKAIPAAAQLAYNRWTAQAAHAQGLSVLLKNNLDQVAALSPAYDGALVEECLGFDECDLLTPFRDAGKAIYVVEYQNASFATAARRSTAARLHLNVVLTDVDVNRLNPITRFGNW